MREVGKNAITHSNNTRSCPIMKVNEYIFFILDFSILSSLLRDLMSPDIFNERRSFGNKNI